MPALDFKIIEDAKTIVEQRTGLTATLEWDTLLIESAGKNASLEDVHRPYAVAAILLGNALNTSVLYEADGAKFGDPNATIRALLLTQAAWDESLSLTVPDAFTIDNLKNALLSGRGSPGIVLTKIGFSA